MRKDILGILTLLFLPSCVQAVCPVCTVAVAGGVELSRWLGVDDVISGIWIGALIISTILWLISWLDKKNIRFRFRNILVLVSFYVIVILPLYWMNFISLTCNMLWGINKILLGIIFGSLVFSAGAGLNEFLKKKNKNKVYFPYQRVVLPVLFLIAVSVIFYFITGC